MTVSARLNHGRWIADCPNCRSAEIVYSGHPFICGNIEHGQQNYDAFILQSAIVRAEKKNKKQFNHKEWNIPIQLKTAKKRVIDNGNTHDVIWPTESKKLQIETLTKVRPKKARNWPVVGDIDKNVPFNYDEDIKKLANENAHYGLGD